MEQLVFDVSFDFACPASQSKSEFAFLCLQRQRQSHPNEETPKEIFPVHRFTFFKMLAKGKEVGIESQG
ncbi:hypothetical protein HUU05_02680 [candidate division KSB1 bacterium]|nr:hypothetical protein [candidate division KSB1 bacterium]